LGALITGGGGTLGRAVGVAFAARGVTAALMDIDYEAADAAASAIDGAHAIRGDVTQPGDVDAAWREATDALGQLDVVVNAAGVFQPSAFADLTHEQWAASLAVHLTGPFNVSQRAARDWIDAGVRGSIVNVSSNAAVTAQAGGSADYGATKAGLLGLTTHLAVELGPLGVRTNAVLPGPFRSRLTESWLADPAGRETVRAGTPLARAGEPEEIAAAIVFLALDGTYVNGAALVSDGGTTVQMY
jgi:NAD(P)-dependent dehydrogenase (short-subunit alcohol dehydrogenase family)